MSHAPEMAPHWAGRTGTHSMSPPRKAPFGVISFFFLITSN